MALPFFRLPVLVIRLVFQIMGFLDILVLTNASTKSKRIVKNLLPIRSCHMQMIIKKSLSQFSFMQNGAPSAEHVIFSEMDFSQIRNIFHLKIGTINHVPAVFSSSAINGSSILKIYWTRNIHHGTQLYNTLLEIFGMAIWGYKINLNDVAVETHRNWFNWINGTLSVPHDIQILGECSFPEYVWILENVRTDKWLVFSADPTDYSANFESLDVNFTFKVETIAISDGRWITMRHFESIEARDITIWRFPFTALEINAFLKKWRNLEEATNLKELTLYFDRVPEEAEVLEGLDATNEKQVKPDDAWDQWSFKMGNGEKCTMICTFYLANREFGFQFRIAN